MKLLAIVRHLPSTARKELSRFQSRRCSVDVSLHSQIRRETEITSDHLTPEIKLHLITPNSRLWHSDGGESPFIDPFWAFYWPGGQVLTRYILDNGHVFKFKTVIDIGSGCGASAIASKMVGASRVIVNDIDTVALTAAKMNASLNEVALEYASENLIGQFDITWDILLLGDMFYDEAIVNEVHPWVHRVHQGGIDVFVGDPGRFPLQDHAIKHYLSRVAEYNLPENCLRENNGMSSASVWKFVND